MNITEKIYNLYKEDYSEFLNYKLTQEEIEETENIVYDITSSMFPLGDFMNDAKRFYSIMGEKYNYNQAMKDLCLIVYYVQFLEDRINF